MSKYNYQAIIEKIGHEGDGIAYIDGKSYAFANCLISDEVKFNLDENNNITQKEIVFHNKNRVSAACPHFEECGGCSLQHLNENDYIDYKKNRIIELLPKYKDLVQEPILTQAGIRRRTTFTLYKDGDIYLAGYKQKQSIKIVPIKTCKVVTIEIEHLIANFLPYMRDYVHNKSSAKVICTQCDNGLDIEISGCPAPNHKKRETIFKVAVLCNIIRITWDSEMIYQTELPYTQITDIDINLPAASSFLQASKQSELILQDIVLKALPKKKNLKIVDLFSGLGTFSIALLKNHHVSAYETEKKAIDILNDTIKRYPSKYKFWGVVRDLYKDPLNTLELNKFDIIVLDPPRQGALKQSEAIANSKCQTIIYVSCNPASFARDCSIIEQKNYTLKTIQPIDQFKWSHHIELVAVFEKNK